jgi:CSLREA domain-containing protein
MVRRSVTLMCCVGVAGLAVPALASATTITVNSSADHIAAGGDCTLREAILAANTQTARGGCAAGSGADAIVLAVPRVTLALAGSGEDGDLTGDLDVTGVVTITGAAGGTVIDGAGLLDRVFDIRSSAQATVTNVTITGGVAPVGADGTGVSLANPGFQLGNDGGAGEGGGGVRNAGVLKLQGVTISDNATSKGGSGDSVSAPDRGSAGGAGGPGGAGGAIASSGSLTVANATITANATGPGGTGGGAVGPSSAAPNGLDGLDGLAGAGGAGGPGGGIYSTGLTTISDSVISNNHTGPGGQGGAGHGGGGMTVSSGPGGAGAAGQGGSGGVGGFGGGIAVGDGTLRITGSLISANATGPGAAAGSAFGGAGGGGNLGGTGNGPGGAGGTAIVPSGGNGGAGAGLAAIPTGNPLGHPALLATSDTVAQNTTGAGGDDSATTDAGAPGGNGGANQNGGNGGQGTGGSGGDGGDGAGALQGAGGSLVLVADTIVANSASAVGGGRAVGHAGTGGNGSGSGPDGSPGMAINGIAGGPGTGGGLTRADVADSIITGNTPDQCNAPQTVTGPQGANVSSAVGCGGVVADPDLGPLEDNGGPSATYALLTGSPAIDEVPALGATCPATDQRGVARPQGAGCDAGAYEHAPPGVATAVATVTVTTATLSAAINPNQRSTTVHFLWGPGATRTSLTADQLVTPGTSAVSVSASLTGLTPATTYTYTVVATNADGTSTGAVQTFTTSPAPGPGPGFLTATARPPALSSLTLKPSAFRPQTKKLKKSRGTTISYTDTQAAKTTFTVQHKLAGVVKGKKCVAPPKHRAAGKKPKACPRYVLLKGSFSHTDTMGRDSVKWSGTLGGKAVPAGAYRLLARPTLGHVTGATVEHAFTIKRA